MIRISLAFQKWQVILAGKTEKLAEVLLKEV